MKVLRVLANIVIGIILFVLIFSLSFVKTTESFLEKDLIVGLVKTSITETLKENNNIDSDKEAILDEIFSDSMTKDVVQIVIDNYKLYNENRKNFSVSDSDVEIITNFALRYKNQIGKISKDAREITDAELKEILSKENINQVSSKIYEELSDDAGEEFREIFDVYDVATSKSVTIIMIGVILFFIVLLALINWSLYKWVIVPGVCLIISGLLLSLIYFIGLFINELIDNAEVLNKALGNINVSSYLIAGGIEILVGIILIVVYNSVKNRPFNEQINNLGVGE